MWASMVYLPTGSTKLLKNAPSTVLAAGRNMEALVKRATSSQITSSVSREMIV